MKKIYTIMILLFLVKSTHLNAQCSISVPNYSTGANVTTPFNISYVQTFKPTCSGTLKSIVFPAIYSSADDFRGSGYFVECRIKNASGTILGIAPRTDQWFPGATVTFDFACTNVSLILNTTYQFELKEIDPGGTSTYPVFLLRRSNTASVYADGNCIIDGTSYPNGDLYGWNVNLANGSIASSNSSVTQTLAPCGGFYNASNELITSVLPGTTNGISGSTTAKNWIETTQPGDFVKRHYEIAPATNATTATGKVSLYFTQPEFDAFNSVNAIKLPANPTDASGKANLLVEKRAGTSSNGTGLPGSYTGTPVTINPNDADINWNAVTNRWDVSFDVTGFSGFFVKTVVGVLPLKWLSFTGSINPKGVTVLNWKVEETNVANYTVEKSTNGINYVSIEKIQSKGDGLQNYSTLDPQKLISTGFYRILQTDRDGHTSYSPTVKIKATNPTVKVYPTVFTSGFNIITEAVTAARLADVQGRILQTIKLTAGNNYISGETLAKGIYILILEDGTQQRIVKQ